MAVLIIVIIILILAILTYLAYSLNLFGLGKKLEDGSEILNLENSDDEEKEESEDQEEDLINLFEAFADVESQDEAAVDENKTELVDDEDLDFDKLTELMTCRTFLIECGKVLELAKQTDSRYAMAYLDIDRFRFINSIKGYSLGDFVLTKLAQEIRTVFPDGSKYARVSADHFAVLFPINGDPPFEAYADQIKKICEKIRMDMALKGTIRSCFGIAVTESASNPISYNATALFRKANIARHCLKASKSESYSIYDETMISSSLYGESLLEDYNENQYGDDFVMRFQSITDLNRKHIAGCDVLVCWTCHEDSAGEHIAADNGRIPTNVTKVIYHACRTAGRWRKMEKEPVPFYIYITETEFFCADLDEFVAKCLNEFQLEPGMIYLVVDANVLRLDWTISNRQIKRLRDTGLKVGVSGIGVGTKSLDFLVGLPVNFIKLNSSFSTGINKITEKADAVRAITVMAQAQNLRVVFEGVNTIEQMQEHMKLGSVLVEGRCNGVPMSADEFVKMLDDYSPSAKAADSTVILDEMKFNHGEYLL